MGRIRILPPDAPAILRYVEGRTLLRDLAVGGIRKVDDKDLVRWRVNGLGLEASGKCWEDRTLFQAFTAWYEQRRVREGATVLCMVSGEETIPAKQHAKGIIPMNGNAKLISANDSSNFTYRGRFTEESQAATVGYEASQKAHNALRWLAAEQGTVYGGRTFLCWNPQGKEVYRADLPLLGSLGKPTVTPTDYRKELRHTLEGFQTNLPVQDADVVIASFDAATTGRLALTYYRELRESDFLQRLYDWDESCCWWAWNPETKRYNTIQSPSLRQIVQCAFGLRREEKGRVRLVVDDRVMRQQIQRLLACRIERAAFPTDILRALTARASMPQAFDGVYQNVLITACAAIKKYHHDHGKGEIEMTLEEERNDRNYQFGRLLAVLDRAERDYYQKVGESRQTNASKYMTEFARHPLATYEHIHRFLEQAYLPRILPWQEERFRKLNREINEILHSQFTINELKEPLDDTYLIGFYVQSAAFFKPQEKQEEDEQ